MGSSGKLEHQEVTLPDKPGQAKQAGASMEKDTLAFARSDALTSKLFLNLSLEFAPKRWGSGPSAGEAKPIFYAFGDQERHHVSTLETFL